MAEQTNKPTEPSQPSQPKSNGKPGQPSSKGKPSQASETGQPSTPAKVSQSPDAIEAEIAATRARLASTIDELAVRAQPREIARRQTESVKASLMDATHTPEGDLRVERVGAIAAAAAAVLVVLAVLHRRHRG